MRRQIFKQGDKVFDLEYNWGRVERAVSNENIVVVSFGQNIRFYHYNGCRYNTNLKTLSFTAYTLESGGFNQKIVICNKSEILSKLRRIKKEIDVLINKINASGTK